eukprot:1059372-Pelagomonas_calceolata.AAC.19
MVTPLCFTTQVVEAMRKQEAPLHCFAFEDIFLACSLIHVFWSVASSPVSFRRLVRDMSSNLMRNVLVRQHSLTESPRQMRSLPGRSASAARMPAPSLRVARCHSA